MVVAERRCQFDGVDLRTADFKPVSVDEQLHDDTTALLPFVELLTVSPLSPTVTQPRRPAARAAVLF